jgi:plasmid stabilization system protein ParE
MNAKRRIPLSVDYSPQSRRDLFAIADWNEKEYGVAHAARYIGFLKKIVVSLGRDEIEGHGIEERPDLRFVLARRRNRGHGHVVVYRVHRSAIEIVRLFHTAEDWTSKLS